MWLINTKTLKLEEFQSNIPTYAILSHTWGDEEVSFVGWQSNFTEAKTKAGFDKIQRSCKQACDDGYQYLWCDTNCIDKRSSAELSEAINSMFTWYKNSAVCYAYLVDVPPSDLSRFSSSRWFTRGWTLQELLAPRSLTFFAQDWSMLGTRTSLSKMVFEITKIKENYMGDQIYQASISERMSWVSRRETSRVEDIAYCMLGIFDINMPLLYGEGPKAFIRLQEEIIRISNDQSIFCWHWDDKYVPKDWSSMLSPSSRTFEHSGSYCIAPGADDTASYSMNNSGLSISLAVLTMAATKKDSPGFHTKSDGQESDRCLAVLNVHCREVMQTVGLLLRRPPQTRRFERLHFPPCPVPVPQTSSVLPTTMCIAGSRDRGSLMISSRDFDLAPRFGLPVGFDPVRRFEVLVAASNPSGANKSITIYPRSCHLRYGFHELRPIGPDCYGIFFSLATTIERRTGDAFKESISVAAICFVGVKVQGSSTDWGCKVLELRDTTVSSLDVQERISHYGSKIRSVIQDTQSFNTLNLTSKSDCIKDEPGIGLSMLLGPSVRASENSTISVAHVRLPLVRRYIRRKRVLHEYSF